MTSTPSTAAIPRRFLYCLAAVSALYALYLFGTANFSADQGISGDGVTYYHMAKNFYYDRSPGWQGTWTSPLYSLLMAIAAPLAGGFVGAGVLVSKTAVLALPAAVFLLTTRLFSPSAGLAAAVLTATHPHFAFMSDIVEPEPLFILCLVLAFWLLAGAGIDDSASLRRRLARAAGAGAFGAAAYLTRAEGFIVFFAALAATALPVLVSAVREGAFRIHRRALSPLAAAVVVFALFSAPYWIFLGNVYGGLVMSPKFSYYQIWMKGKIYGDNNAGEQGNPALWGLTADGRFRWQERRGIGDLVAYLAEDPAKSVRVYLENAKTHVPGFIPNNRGMWRYPQSLPLYFCLPALAWFIAASRRTGDRRRPLLLASAFAMLPILPVLNPGWWKYLVLYAPFVIAAAAQAIVMAAGRWRRPVAAAVCVALIAGYGAWSAAASQTTPAPLHVTDALSREDEQRAAGRWARTRFGPEARYMITWTKLAYYLDGRWTAFPVTGDPELHSYARRHKVDYVVFESFSIDEMDMLIDSFRDSPYFSMLVLYTSPTSTYSVLFLRLK